MTTRLDLSLFLPEPQPRPDLYTIVSVDDHLVEPANVFEGGVPRALADWAPRIRETPAGHQVWLFEDRTFTRSA